MHLVIGIIRMMGKMVIMAKRHVQVHSSVSVQPTFRQVA